MREPGAGAAKAVSIPVPRVGPPALLGDALRYAVPPLLAMLLLGVTWEAWTRLADVPEYVVPGPLAVLDRLFGDLGHFARHGAITLAEAGAGFLLGAAVAVAAATAMAHSRPVERALYPLALLIKVTPIIAVAPLFVIWFGFGSGPKVLIAALITFFPVMVNALVGLRSVNVGALEFFQSLRASRRQVYLKLRLPSALPYLFAAFRIAVPLSVIGAVVAEWFSGDRGLGAVIIVAHNNLDTPTLFSAVFTLAFIGTSLTVALMLVEKRVLFWHESTLEN